MSAHTHAPAAEHHGGSKRLYYGVWTWLLGLTIIEVMLAYFNLPLGLMLFLLLLLSVAKAGLITAYFMHLRFEPARLAGTLIPVLVVAILLLFVSFPEGFRILELGTR